MTSATIKPSSHTGARRAFQDQVCGMLQPGTSALFLMLERSSRRGRRGDEPIQRHGPEDRPV